MKMIFKIFILMAVILAGMIGYFTLRHWFNPARSIHVSEWINHPDAHPDWAIQVGTRCPGASFLLPTNGLIGYLWGDSFRLGQHHQGIDIFGGTVINKTPVVAVYDGYLTRSADWKSSVIVRIPENPLQRGQQIWTYYTHMADESGNSFISTQFPAGSQEVFVKAGTLLGYQGDYSGDANNPVGVHLHFSIVKDDGQGHFLNELDIHNTLDPSPYFKLALNGSENADIIPTCSAPKK
jgi:murein DD-endopeptidase MepM/ murein hydrolase activator NlpD